MALTTTTDDREAAAADFDFFLLALISELLAFQIVNEFLGFDGRGT